MKTKGLTGLFLAQSAAVSLASAEAAKPVASSGAWLKIPDAFMISRFVQAQKAEHATYRVALVVPAGRGTPRVTQSSGRTEVDAVAFDYAREAVANTKSLREMNQAKELVFQLLVAPPALDASFRTADGAKPVPAGKSYYMPTPDVSLSGSALHGRDHDGEVSVRFPASGGRPLEAWMSRSTREPGVNTYFLKFAIGNWQTNRTADRPFVVRVPVMVKRQSFGGRLTTY